MTGVTGDGRWVTGQPRDLTVTLRLAQAGAGRTVSQQPLLAESLYHVVVLE